ncbi:PREDICTED: uncharacterized protein LOC109167104 [Ipomoea nil]|uniref:uncharacterized protein LOC109167104 n=1 Tax=Ipomoea nil TaxID=35883 RepID=UPI000901E19E|nr:PREDICTED: uncharacterized protein LOC109167104 [Ipomoea nil]
MRNTHSLLIIFIFILTVAQYLISSSADVSIHHCRRLLIHTQQRQSPVAHGDWGLGSGFDDRRKILMDEIRKSMELLSEENPAILAPDSGRNAHRYLLSEQSPAIPAPDSGWNAHRYLLSEQSPAIPAPDSGRNAHRYLLSEQSPATPAPDSGRNDHSRLLMEEPRKQSPTAHGDRRRRRLLDSHQSRLLMDEPRKQSPAAHGDRRRLLLASDFDYRPVRVRGTRFKLE